MTAGATREFLGVALAVCGVAALTASAAQLERHFQPNRGENWLPFQRSYLELGAADRATFASLREALLDLETARVQAGAWPDPELLRQKGVPAFSDESLRWSLRQVGTSVNYEGRSTVDGGVDFLVLLLEPEPLLPGQQAELPPPEDEEHHTLSNGMAIHVSVWSKQTRSDGEPLPIPFPQVEGWTQRLGRAPPEAR